MGSDKDLLWSGPVSIGGYLQVYTFGVRDRKRHVLNQHITVFAAWLPGRLLVFRLLAGEDATHKSASSGVVGTTTIYY